MSEQTATPSSHWRAEGQADPHAGHYDCERATLAMGNLTDDQLANAAFMFYDDSPSMQDVLDGKAFQPIAYMTAVKDRIRWLSRSLEKAAAERDALAAELRAIRERRPVAWIATDMDGHCEVGLTKKSAKSRAGESCNYFLPMFVGDGATQAEDRIQKFSSSQEAAGYLPTEDE